MKDLSKLEKIQNAIHLGVKRLSTYNDNIIMFRHLKWKDLETKQILNKQDLKRGLDRLRVAFDRELQKLKYEDNMDNKIYTKKKEIMNKLEIATNPLNQTATIKYLSELIDYIVDLAELPMLLDIEQKLDKKLFELVEE